LAPDSLPLRNYFFSFLVGLNFLGTTYFVGRAIPKHKRWYYQPFISLIFIVTSLMMNGRMSFAFFGQAIQTYALLVLCTEKNKNSIRYYFLLPLSAILAGVSSGTFCLLIASQIGILSINFLARMIRGTLASARGIAHVIYLVIMMASSSPLVFIYVKKNIDYFGGNLNSITKMLNHGVGEHLINHPLIFLLGLPWSFFCIICLFAVTCLLASNQFIYLAWLIIFNIAIGVYGHSTLNLVIPLLVLVGSLIMSKISYHLFYLIFSKPPQVSAAARITR
jgi:hypothetical protein